MATASRMTVRLDELSSVMRHLIEAPIPSEVLEHRRKVLAEAEKVRAEMEPLPGDIKDVIRKQRGEEPLG